jgi:hypothetical protein
MKDKECEARPGASLEEIDAYARAFLKKEQPDVRL